MLNPSYTMQCNPQFSKLSHLLRKTYMESLRHISGTYLLINISHVTTFQLARLKHFKYSFLMTRSLLTCSYLPSFSLLILILILK